MIFVHPPLPKFKNASFFTHTTSSIVSSSTRDPNSKNICNSLGVVVLKRTEEEEEKQPSHAPESATIESLRAEDEAKADADAADGLGYTALHTAVRFGQTDVG